MATQQSTARSDKTLPSDDFLPAQMISATGLTRGLAASMSSFASPCRLMQPDSPDSI